MSILGLPESRTLAFIPRTMNCSQPLQKRCLFPYGNLILNFRQILLAIAACFFASSMSVFAVSTASSSIELTS